MQMTDPAFATFARLIGQAVLPLVPAHQTIRLLADACDIQRTAKGDHRLRVGDIAGHIYWEGATG